MVSRNKGSLIFRQLYSEWQRNAASPQIDALASDLQAEVVVSGSTCVGLMSTNSIPKLFGLIYFLDGHSLVLRQRYRELRDGVFIYVDLKSEVKSEFEGNLVVERNKEPENLWQ